jgi:hypothetical protein
MAATMITTTGHQPVLTYWTYLPVVGKAAADPLLGTACCLTWDEHVDILGLSPISLTLNDHNLYSDGRLAQVIRTHGDACCLTYEDDDLRLNIFVRMGYPDYSLTLWPPRCKTDKFLANNSGQVYVIGNEPDQTIFEDMTPQQYARWWRDVRAYVLARDPTARFCTAGPADPARLRAYLEALPADALPDAIGIHCYAYGGAAVDVNDWLYRLDAQIAVVRELYPDAPLWLTEFGWLGGETATEAQGLVFMRRAVTEIRQRNIERAAWWPTRYDAESRQSSPWGLLGEDGQPTAFGIEYGRLAR